MEEGSKSLVELAREKVRTILAGYHPAPMDEPKLKRLKSMIKSAQEEFNSQS
jgi:trimethylamine:corrinoid methyltransferase-like protein